MRTKEIPPFAPTLMESTRAIGYSTETAIADIIDNSIAAKAGRIDIDFFPNDNPYISILDNGFGMNETELISAMQYGSQNPLDERDKNDLGRYGLGMKTASLSQCRILTVISKKDNTLAGVQWNLNHVHSEGTWSLILLEQEEIHTFPSVFKLTRYETGTLVIWQDLDKFATGESCIDDAFQKKMEPIQEHLSLVFHRYLTGERGLKKLEIYMNNLKLLPYDPFLVDRSQQLMASENIYINGEKVVVTPYILPHVSKLTNEEKQRLGGKEGLRKQQGFYVYRNKRLLIWGTWFRLMRKGDMSKLARVQVDIPNSLDELWTLDIKKSTATPPKEVRQNLGIIIDKIAEGSKRTWTYRGKEETKDSIVHVWKRIINKNNNTIHYEINDEHPLLKALIDSYEGIKPDLMNLIKQIEMNLPLNSLYIDLTNDEKIGNDLEMDSKEIIGMMKKLLDSFDDNEMRKNMVISLKSVEPYCNFVEEIDNALEEGVFYG